MRPYEREAEGQEYRGCQLLAQNIAHFIKTFTEYTGPGKGCATQTRESSGSTQVTGQQAKDGSAAPFTSPLGFVSFHARVPVCLAFLFPETKTHFNIKR